MNCNVCPYHWQVRPRGLDWRQRGCSPREAPGWSLRSGTWSWEKPWRQNSWRRALMRASWWCTWIWATWPRSAHLLPSSKTPDFPSTFLCRFCSSLLHLRINLYSISCPSGNVVSCAWVFHWLIEYLMTLVPVLHSFIQSGSNSDPSNQHKQIWVSQDKF